MKIISGLLILSFSLLWPGATVAWVTEIFSKDVNKDHRGVRGPIGSILFTLPTTQARHGEVYGVYGVDDFDEEDDGDT